MAKITPEQLAKYFHDEYERMAPAFNYETRRETAVPWDNLLPSNKELMTAVATSVLLQFFPEHLKVNTGGTPNEQSTQVDGRRVEGKD